MANKSNVNIYSLLQAEGSAQSTSEGPRKAGAAAAAVVGQQTPAERAAIRAKANAEKAAVADAAKQRADADLAAAALVGPLEGFQTQKSSAPKKDRDGAKKLSREDYAKKPQDANGPRKNYDNKKPYVKRDGESGGKPYVKDVDRRREGKPAGNEGTGNRPPRREFDKHSAGKTGNKFQNKRGGDGAANWGNAVTDAKTNAGTDATWGDEGQTTKVDAKDALWGDEGAKDQPETDETKADADESKEKKEETPAKPAVAAWDDEGFGKMTLQEHQKAEAERLAKLAELTGQKERRAADAVDLKKFQLVEKDNSDEKDELLKKQKKQEAKKAAGAARTGEKAVGLNDLFSVRGQGQRGPRPDGPRGPRPDGPRGPRPDGDRPPRTEGEQGQRQPRAPRVNPNNHKQFPDLGGNKQTKPQHVK